VPRNQEEHRQNSVREGNDEHRLLNAEQLRPNFRQPQFMNSQLNPVAMQQF
jgi:hypothetical protein